MNDVLEEVTSETITKEHVVRRVDDWVARVNGLYDDVESWLSGSWHSDWRRTVVMDEKMMRNFDIGPREVPVLELISDEGGRASLEPRGLWIIGVNGRLDLLAGPKHFLIFDLAKNFSIPDWQIVDYHDRKESKKFDKASLAAALAQ